MDSLETIIKRQAAELGFELVGIAAAETPPGVNRLDAWLARGCAGEMHYMHSQAEARRQPTAILPGVRSIVVVGMSYRPPHNATAEAVSPGDAEADQLRGRISNYAWGRDYHRVVREHLEELLHFVQEQRPGCRGRAVVDTAPLLERDFARLAGLGWFGKNTMLIHKRLGSYFFIGALLLDLSLSPDPPFEANHCGTCTRCLDACPTGAFLGPYELDARRCISYLTIELRGPVPRELRAGMGNWVFGCDVCQEVCPWNRKAPAATKTDFLPGQGKAAPDLPSLLALTPDEFRRWSQDTTLTRAKRRGMLRNAAIALGNAKNPKAVPALIQALDDPEPLVRGAAAWALGCIPSDVAVEALKLRLELESDAYVREEIQAALAAMP